MPNQYGIPLAFRATSVYRHSKWLRRRKRALSFDVWWANGTIDRDIDLVDVMNGRAPADYQRTQQRLANVTPDVGTSPWIQYATGALVDGPA